ILAARDGDAGFAANASHSIVIVDRINRLLEPGEIVLLELARHGDGLVRRPGAVGIDHKRDIRSGSSSARGHRLDQMFMQLDGGVAFPDRLLWGASDESGIAVAEQSRIARNTHPSS